LTTVRYRHQMAGDRKRRPGAVRMARKSPGDGLRLAFGGSLTA
jgi:hypothetical protein